MDAKLVKLSDGRNLAYAEYGKSDGIPVFFLHGSPGSRIAFDDAIANANEFGLWMINPERPGYGFSDFKPYETILEWTNDLGELADNLHLERFGVLGVSAGGPYAVACAYGLGERVTKVAVASSSAPYDPSKEPSDRPTWAEVEEEIRPLAESAQKGREAVGEYFDEMIADISEADRSLIQPWLRNAFITMSLEAFRNGIEGVVHDRLLRSRPWGFDLSDIHVPVHVWHGDQDNAEYAQYLADHIPGSGLTILENAGHLLTPDEMRKVYAYFGE